MIGAQLDDGSDMGPHLVLSAYGIIIFTQSTERARFLIRDACAAPQTHLTDYHLKLRRGKMIIGGCGLSVGSVSNQPTSFK